MFGFIFNKDAEIRRLERELTEAKREINSLKASLRSFYDYVEVLLEENARLRASDDEDRAGARIREEQIRAQYSTSKGF